MQERCSDCNIYISRIEYNVLYYNVMHFPTSEKARERKKSHEISIKHYLNFYGKIG